MELSVYSPALATNKIISTIIISTIKTSHTMGAVRKKYEIASQQIKETAAPPKRQPGHMRSFAATHLSNSTQARSPQLYFAVENLPRDTKLKSLVFQGAGDLLGGSRDLLKNPGRRLCLLRSLLRHPPFVLALVSNLLPVTFYPSCQNT